MGRGRAAAMVLITVLFSSLLPVRSVAAVAEPLAEGAGGGFSGEYFRITAPSGKHGFRLMIEGNLHAGFVYGSIELFKQKIEGRQQYAYEFTKPDDVVDRSNDMTRFSMDIGNQLGKMAKIDLSGRGDKSDVKDVTANGCSGKRERIRFPLKGSVTMRTGRKYFGTVTLEKMKLTFTRSTNLSCAPSAECEYYAFYGSPMTEEQMFLYASSDSGNSRVFIQRTTGKSNGVSLVEEVEDTFPGGFEAFNDMSVATLTPPEVSYFEGNLGFQGPSEPPAVASCGDLYMISGTIDGAFMTELPWGKDLGPVDMWSGTGVHQDS